MKNSENTKLESLIEIFEKHYKYSSENRRSKEMIWKFQEILKKSRIVLPEFDRFLKNIHERSGEKGFRYIDCKRNLRNIKKLMKLEI